MRIGNAHVHPGGRPLSLLLSTLADALRLVIADAVDHFVDAARVQLCTQLYCTAVLCTQLYPRIFNGATFLMGPHFAGILVKHTYQPMRAPRDKENRITIAAG